MPDIDLKTATPDTSLPTTGFLFGADSQASASPSVYSTQTVATTLLGSTSLTGATITTSQPVLDLSQTWNASGVTFTGLRFNAATGSSANSAAGSLLMDLQLEGSSRFSVNKSGQIDAAWNGINFLRLSAADYQVFNGANRNLIMGGNAQGLGLNPAWSVSWSSSSTDAFASRDLFLTRRAAANLRLGAADVGATTATVTITIAAPGVVTWNSHGLSTGTPVVFTTDGALPTGITAGTTYYAVVVGANTFQIASSVANAIAAVPTVITTSGTQSGTHTGTRYNITQRLGMQSITGVTDRLGADLVIQGSQGTGTGAGGSIVFQVAPAGAVSNGVQNALETLLTINPNRTVSIGGLTIDPSNGGMTFAQTFGITMQTSNAFTIRHGNGDGLDVRPVSSGSPNIILKNASNVIQAALWGEATNTLALRNGGTSGTPVPQTFRVYHWTDGTNSEFGFIRYSGNVLQIGHDSTGTGNNGRTIEIRTQGFAALSISGANATFGVNSIMTGASINGITNIASQAGYTEMIEMTAPAVPATNRVRIYAEDNGSGKTRLMALFNTGAAQQIAIEP